SRPNLKCLSFNAHSITARKRLSHIQRLTRCQLFDIIVISETWLHSDFSSSLLDPLNKFLVLRNDRVPGTKERGAGLAVLIKSQMHVSEIDSGEKEGAQIVCFGHASLSKIRYGCVYRSTYLLLDENKTVLRFISSCLD